MKLVKQPVNEGSQDHGHHREKNNTAVESVERRKQFTSCGRYRIDRPHAGENHGGIQKRVDPRQIGEVVISRTAH